MNFTVHELPRAKADKRHILQWLLERSQQGGKAWLKAYDDALATLADIQEGMIDTTSASGELIFNIFSALAQFERRLIQERTKAGLAVARARGRHGGRPRLDSEEARVLAAKKLAKDTSLSIDEICSSLKISRSTYYRYLAMEPDGRRGAVG